MTQYYSLRPFSGTLGTPTPGPADHALYKEDQVTDLLPTGAPLSGDFWQAMTFEELAASQDVKPLTHIDALVGTWPGDVDDDFEDAIHNLRQRAPGTD